jgi:hypothetical protein
MAKNIKMDEVEARILSCHFPGGETTGMRCIAVLVFLSAHKKVRKKMSQC